MYGEGVALRPRPLVESKMARVTPNRLSGNTSPYTRTQHAIKDNYPKPHNPMQPSCPSPSANTTARSTHPAPPPPTVHLEQDTVVTLQFLLHPPTICAILLPFLTARPPPSFPHICLFTPPPLAPEPGP